VEQRSRKRRLGSLGVEALYRRHHVLLLHRRLSVAFGDRATAVEERVVVVLLSPLAVRSDGDEVADVEDVQAQLRSLGYSDA